MLFTLPPNDSVLAKIRFTPPAKHRTGKTVDDALLFGDLVMLYSNEEAQRLPLEAHIYHPQLNLHPKVCLPVCPLRARCWVASCRARLC